MVQNIYRKSKSRINALISSKWSISSQQTTSRSHIRQIDSNIYNKRKKTLQKFS